MNRNFLQWMLTCAAACAGLLFSCAAQAGTEALVYREQVLVLEGEARTVRVPQGYRLEWLAAMESPRMLTFTNNGDLFAGSRSGKVYRLRPPYTAAEVLVELDDYPHSVAFRDGEILIAQTGGVYRAPYRAGQPHIAPAEVKLLAALPGGSGHDSRTVGVGPDGRVYASLGIQRNCSDQYLGPGYPFSEQRGGVLVLREGGGKPRWEPYASGLRNPVGIAWHPQTGVLYASNNGPDHHGYDQPPEYFSKLAAGSFHGMPWFQFDGKRLRPDDCAASVPPRPSTDVTFPVATFPARNAPLGVAFVPKGGMDARLEFDAVVALHGSWGTRPRGGFIGNPATRREPGIVAVRFVNGKAERVDELVSGFQLPKGSRWARPAGVAIGPDGDLYFSSDSDNGGLFRLRRVSPDLNQ
ncbi:MAG TPA: sugar dehydrogenase [Gallionella sp.]